MILFGCILVVGSVSLGLPFVWSTPVLRLVSLLFVIVSFVGFGWSLVSIIESRKANSRCVHRFAKEAAVQLYLCGGEGELDRVLVYGGIKDYRLKLLTDEEAITRLKEEWDLPSDAQLWQFSGMSLGRTYYTLPTVKARNNIK